MALNLSTKEVAVAMKDGSLQPDSNVEDALKNLLKAYFALRISGGVRADITMEDLDSIDDLMFMSFLRAHGVGLEEFNNVSHRYREELQRQFVAWRAIMEAYIGFGYLSADKAMQIDIMEMIVHTDTTGKVIQTLGLIPSNADKEDFNLPTLSLYELPPELLTQINQCIAEGKTVVELGRFARAGTINYVRKEMDLTSEEIGSSADPFPSWIERKLTNREKVFYNIRLILSALGMMKKLGADALIANIADEGQIFVRNAKGEEISLELRGAGEFFEPIVAMLGGTFYDVTWKEDQVISGPFAKYAKGHPDIRVAFIPEINYARVSRVLISKFADFFRDTKNRRELHDLQTIAAKEQ